MEFRRSKNGKRLFTLTQRKEILGELKQGLTPAEVCRKYDLPMQNLYRWRRLYEEGGEKALKSKEEVVPISEVKKLKEEVKQLQRALGKMTMERDILKDAVEIAREKKWV